MNIKIDFSEFKDLAKSLSDRQNLHYYLKKATQEIAKVLHEMLVNNTPVVSSELLSGWYGDDNLAYIVKKVNRGFQVTLTNSVEYALYVNDGHFSYNQFNVGGEPYVVNDAHRTVTYTQGTKDIHFVYGHFFVEASIEDSEFMIEQALFPLIQKWWESCFNG